MFFAVPAHAAEKKIGGWAWNSIIGWIRQRNTIQDQAGQTITGEVGVTRDDAGNLTGWSWSQKVGWICWGTTCKSFPGSNDTVQYGRKTLPSGVKDPVVVAKVSAQGIRDQTTGKTMYPVNGWIKILSLKDRGWVSLSKESAEGTADYGVYYDKEKNEFSGWAWNIPPQLSGRTSIGWIVFSGRTLFTTTLVPPGGGLPKRACEPNCAVVVEDVTDVANPVSKWKTQEIGAWVKTKGGNIYARAGFDAASEPPSDVPPENYKNAEYLMLTGKTPQNQPGDILGWLSGCDKDEKCKKFGILQGGQVTKKGVVDIASPKRVTVRIRREGPSGDLNRLYLRNSYLDLDIQALTTPAFVGTINIYGRKVIQLLTTGFRNPSTTAEAKLYDVLSSSLTGDTIYYVNDNLTIGAAMPRVWNIFNGGAERSGARTVVVEGDLTIRQPILYDQSANNARSLASIASVAWIVLKDPSGRGGNIRIADCLPPSDDKRLIADLSGIFFAEGEISTGNGDARLCQKPVDVRLRINGMLIAKSLKLERKYGGAERNEGGAENIVNDGRALVSIPPGLEDFLKNLPIR